MQKGPVGTFPPVRILEAVMTITLELPKGIANTLAAGWSDVPRKTLEALAVQAYKDGILSRGQVGEMLSMNFWETEAFLKERGALLHYDEKDLEEDHETHQRLFSQIPT
jgi:predicted HTH domain antitoxin